MADTDVDEVEDTVPSGRGASPGWPLTDGAAGAEDTATTRGKLKDVARFLKGDEDVPMALKNDEDEPATLKGVEDVPLNGVDDDKNLDEDEDDFFFFFFLRR